MREVRYVRSNDGCGCGCGTVVFIVLAAIAVKHCTEDERAPAQGSSATRTERPSPVDQRPPSPQGTVVLRCWPADQR